MQHSRPPLSGKTQLYGFFADPVDHLRAPTNLNARFDRQGIDAVCVPLHVTAEHFAATVAGMRHLRNFAGYLVSIPHKVTAACLCDALLPHAQACGAVGVIRVDPDGQWIGETFDGVAMVKAIAAQRPLNATTRVLLVGAGGYGAGDCRGAGVRRRRLRGHCQSNPGEDRGVGPHSARCRPHLCDRGREHVRPSRL